MERLELAASPRQIVGKKVRFLRRQGLVPGHVFGHNTESLPIQIEASSLKKLLHLAGTSQLIALNIQDTGSSNVLVREVQRDPVSDDLLHVDFYQVTMGEKIKAQVPLFLVGASQAATKLGLLVQALHSLEVECLPDELPPRLEIDVSGLTEVDQAIYVKDVPRDRDITILNDPEQTVARVQAMLVEKVAAPAEVSAPAEAAAPEGAAAPAEAAAPARPTRQRPAAAKAQS